MFGKVAQRPFQLRRATREQLDKHRDFGCRLGQAQKQTGARGSVGEVEDVIAGNPAVTAVAVVGVPDAKWGEAVTALVVAPEVAETDREKLTAELVAAVRESKGSVQAPKHVLYVDAIPLTGLGKPDKKAARHTAVGLLSPQ